MSKIWIRIAQLGALVWLLARFVTDLRPFGAAEVDPARLALTVAGAILILALGLFAHALAAARREDSKYDTAGAGYVSRNWKTPDYRAVGMGMR